MRMEKITAIKAMDAAYRHVYREEMPLNADPTLSAKNIHDIHQTNAEGKQLSYNESFAQRIGQLDYYKDHKIRKNAVRGIDVLFSYSKNAEGTFDRQAWIRRNAEWLNEHFSKAADGRSNIISVVYHEDEQSFHGHAFVIPIDERGRLNCRRYMNGTLGELQTSYAEAMKEFGLERGIEGSTADHRTMRQMYAEANRTAQLSKPFEGETALHYYQRIQKEAESYNLHMHLQAKKKIQREREKFDRDRKKSLDLLKAESSMIKKDNAYAIQEAEKKVQSAYKRLRDLQAEYEEKLEKIVIAGTDPADVLNGYEHYKKLQLGLQQFEAESPEQAQQLASLITTLENNADISREEEISL